MTTQVINLLGQEFKKVYEQNECDNLHSENVSLLAGLSQDVDLILQARKIVELHSELGYLPYALNTYRREIEQQACKKIIALYS